MRAEACTWIDIERPTQEDMDFLSEEYGFHKLTLEDVVSARQRSKIERHADHLFVILRFPVPAGDKPASPRSQVSFFIGKDYVVTVHEGDLPPIHKTWQAFRGDATRLQAGASFLVYRLLDELVDGVFPLLEALTGRLGEIEEAVFDDRVEVIRAVTDLRRSAHYMRTTILPLKRVVAELSTELWGMDKSLVVYLKDVNDHLEKLVEKLDEIRETIEIYKDTDVLLSTAKTNRILALLTIAFTLAIPATVVGTFYGMNVNLPGGIEAGAWTFLGPYTTFLLIVAFSLVVPAIAMVWAFRHLKWI
ncbi:MAG TPA: magnesium transporter CorA family protein [Candidatus Thermoplasmatota archaeon]|nr:magnesium transporter CorA family protein [Candidatus Thermoplasmatota archaeon]